MTIEDTTIRFNSITLPNGLSCRTRGNI